MKIEGSATVTIGNLQYDLKDLVMDTYEEEFQEQYERIARQSGYSTLFSLSHHIGMRHKLNTPRLRKHFEEVRVPWDVLKVKNKLKRG